MPCCRKYRAVSVTLARHLLISFAMGPHCCENTLRMVILLGTVMEIMSRPLVTMATQIIPRRKWKRMLRYTSVVGIKRWRTQSSQLATNESAACRRFITFPHSRYWHALARVAFAQWSATLCRFPYLRMKRRARIVRRDSSCSGRDWSLQLVLGSQRA